MDVKVCKNCRRLFNYIRGPELCPACINLLSENNAESVVEATTSVRKGLAGEDESKFEQVRDYIITHPRATVAEIAEANDIGPSKIFEWIRGDRLEFSDDSMSVWFACENCGVKIRSGRFCNQCKSR